MKKSIIIFGAALLLVTAFSSCKKDYTCECTASMTINGVTTSASASGVINDTKSKAKEACEKESNTTSGITTVCKIK